MASIYLIRHGQASYGTDNYDELSPLGMRQSELLGHYLRDCNIHFDAIYSGNLQRQMDTAKLAAAHQPEKHTLRTDARFNEVRNNQLFTGLGPIVARTNSQLAGWIQQSWSSSKHYQKALEAVFNYWVSPLCDEPGIMSWDEYSGDVREGIAEVVRDQGSGKTVGIFTSGGTIATIVSQVLGLKSEHTYKFFEPMINCSVTRLLYSGNKISLAYFNDHSYLDLLGKQQGEEMVTFR